MAANLSLPDIAINDPNWLILKRTPRVCQFFNKHSIMFVRGELTPDEHIYLYISKHGTVEQYVLFGGEFAHSMGAFSYNHSSAYRLQAGRYCSIGNGLGVFGERHPIEWVTTSNITYCFGPHWNKPNFLRAHQELMDSRWSPLTPPEGKSNPVAEHDVWIAENVLLAGGITLSTGSIVGAGSVVTKDVAPYMIVGGNPARPIRRRFSDQLCERLLSSRWWELHPNALFELDSSDPQRFLDQLEEARLAGTAASCPVRAFTWEDILDEISTISTDPPDLPPEKAV